VSPVIDWNGDLVVAFGHQNREMFFALMLELDRLSFVMCYSPIDVVGINEQRTAHALESFVLVEH